ncbi:MAG: M24 family metallopeptidase [Nitriliruptorales bacterium]|nr:M24 family metallopeptidase [Nitriliruptorales bacterium]
MFVAERSPRSAYYPRFSEQEHGRRWAGLVDLMDAEGLAGVVLYGSRATSSWPIFYLSNWIPTRDTYLIVPRHGSPALIVQLQNHVQCAADMSVVDDVRYGGRAHRGQPDSIPTVVGLLKDRGLSEEPVGFLGSPTADLLQRLGEELPQCQWRPIGSRFSAATSRKSEEEIERLRRAATVTDAGLEALRDGLRAGMTEHDIAGLLEHGCRLAGGAFGIRHLMTTSMTTPDCGVPAQYPSARPVNVGDVVVVELSGTWGNYSAQALRTFAVGTTLTESFRRLHATAEDAFHRIASVLRHGATVEDVHDAASVIEKSGYTIIDDLLHGANQSRPIVRTHGASDGVDTRFQFERGMAVVIQPNVTTLDLRAGVQFGEMVVVRDDGTERLHHVDRRAFEHVGAA